MILLIVLFFFVIILILNYRYKNSFYYKNLMEFENRPINGISWPENLKIVNLGSVHSRFAFQYFNDEGVSLARAPQSLYYDIQLLENYSEHIPRNSVVIAFFPVCLFALKNYNDIAQNAKYYFELPKERIEGYSRLKHIVSIKFPIAFSGKKIIYSIVNRKVGEEWKYKGCVVPEDELQSVAQAHYDVWKKQFHLEDMQNANIDHLKEIFEYNRLLLQRLVTLCKKEKWKLVFVTGPMTRRMNDLMSEEFLENFYYSNFKDIVEKNNILYLDYRLDDLFQDNHNLFWNGVDWLSEDGRRLFMNKLENDLLAEGYLEV